MAMKKKVESAASAEPVILKDYKLVRTQNAGVFAGTLVTAEGPDVVLIGARRIWQWKGAATLSELAMKGVAFPEECKFPAPMVRVHLFGVIEIIDATEEARDSIQSVPVWTAHTGE